MEKCWKIKESYPIEVEAVGGRIIVPPMTMTYETFGRLGDNLKLDDATWDYRERVGLDCGEKRKFQNDVRGFQYNYKNGSARFTYSTKQDLDNWLQLYSEFVVLKEIS